MLTAAQFIARRGEFTPTYQAHPEKIQAALDAAALETDPDWFKSATDEAHMWLAAHILAADPMGRDARVVGRKAQETTLYMTERKRYEAAAAAAWGAGDLSV